MRTTTTKKTAAFALLSACLVGLVRTGESSAARGSAMNRPDQFRRSGKFENVDERELAYLVQNRMLEQQDNYDAYDGYDNYNGNDGYDAYDNNGGSSSGNGGSSSSNGGSSSGSSNGGSSSSTSSYKSSSSGAYGVNFFVDSQDTYYNGYQQAWRYLGHLVKCGYPSDRYNQQNSHSQDENDEWEGNNYCQRYLVWAAVSSSFVLQSPSPARKPARFSLSNGQLT